MSAKKWDIFTVSYHLWPKKHIKNCSNFHEQTIAELFWTLVGFAALNVSFAILQICSLPPGDIARTVRRGNTAFIRPRQTRAEKNTHEPPQKLNNYIQEQFSSAVICI